MKTKAILLGSLAIALAACSHDENVATDTGNGQAVFFASIEGQNKTRAYDRTWEKNDLIGIIGTTGNKTYTNVAYKTENGNGNFKAATSGTEIYYQDDNAVSFTAYYPWKDLAAGVTTIEADTWVQSIQKSFDFLSATGTGSKSVPNVAFKFDHKMAKIVLTIKKGTDINWDDVKDAALSLEGFKHTGTFNTADGTTATEDGVTVMWQFAHNTSDPTYNAPSTENTDNETIAYALIMFPQEFSDKLPFSAQLSENHALTAQLDFTEANRNVGDKNPKNEWIAGRQYNMSVTLNKTSITVDGCEISAWKPADGGNVDAD